MLAPPCVAVEDALFVPDGESFVPTEHARGPWDPRSQHGGAPAALLGRAIEALPTETPMTVVRITVEILRPVPLTRLTPIARLERGGRRVQLATAVLRAGDDDVCRATAWRIRVTSLDLPPITAPVPFPGPEDGSPFELESDEPALHRTGMELRFVRGSFWEMGPATAWLRLRHPVVAGETPSPLMRALAAADFGNGISRSVDFDHLFINTDLTVYLHRLPAGEWVCLDATTTLQPAGVGLAESALYDERGPIGRSLQALLVDDRRT